MVSVVELVRLLDWLVKIEATSFGVLRSEFGCLCNVPKVTDCADMDSKRRFA